MGFLSSRNSLIDSAGPRFAMVRLIGWVFLPDVFELPLIGIATPRRGLLLWPFSITGSECQKERHGRNRALPKSGSHQLKSHVCATLGCAVEGFVGAFSSGA